MELPELMDEFKNALFVAVVSADDKHPHKGLRNDDHWDETSERYLDALRKCNDAREKLGEYSWHRLLEEEATEAAEQIAAKNWDAAREELLHVACVAFRAWRWCGERAAEAGKGGAQ